jgi:Mg/Co/Ni transporter MgtE
MVGVHVEQERSRSVWWILAHRFPWLLCNIASGLAAALVSELFQDLLKAVVALAFFIPLVLTLAESVAMQSVTMSLQTLRVRASAAREIRVGLLLGLVSGDRRPVRTGVAGLGSGRRGGRGLHPARGGHRSCSRTARPAPGPPAEARPQDCFRTGRPGPH